VVRAVLISTSRASEAFHKARQLGEILLSLTVAEELNDVLGREKFDRYITREDRERFLAASSRAAKFIEVTEQIVACRDPGDDRLQELAVSGNATCIVTADVPLIPAAHYIATEVRGAFRRLRLCVPSVYGLQALVCEL
jgi:uncharacterized protein